MILKPSICGDRMNPHITDEECSGSLHFDGIDDVTINQGVGIDLTDGVSAYDTDGEEINYKVSPSKIEACDVGEHEVTYTAVGYDPNTLKPYACGDNELTTEDCDLTTLVEKRIVTIEQADPPVISGVDNLEIDTGDTVDLMEDVSAVDDNGNTAEVNFLGGVYDDEAEGSIATFETDLKVPMKSLVADIEPVQDGTPNANVGTDSTPYSFRATDGGALVGEDVNSVSEKIIGGTVAWNQLYNTSKVATTSAGLTSQKDTTTGAVTLNGTVTNKGNAFGLSVKNIQKHIYLLSDVANQGLNIHLSSQSFGQSSGSGRVVKNTSANATWYYTLNIQENVGTVVTDFVIKPMVIDLTQMFGSTIADYIYSLEQANSGAGVAWFKKLFPKDYYEYNAGELLSVEGLESHDTVGFNQFDISRADLYQGNFDAATPLNVITREYTRVLPNTTYNFHSEFNFANTNRGRYIRFYDANKNQLTALNNYTDTDFTFTTPSDCHYIRFMVYYGNGVTPSDVENANICINLSWSGWRNGEYEEYVKHSYPLDSDLVLRGIPKLDSSNNLYYDGDTYEADGTVTRKYGVRAYQSGDETDGSTMITDGTNTVYALSTPTTSSATAYTSPQTVDPYGTEEYVDYGVSQGTRDVAVPVGHESTYMNICPISGWDSVSVTVEDDATTPTMTRTYTELLGRTVYGGTVDLVSGVLTVTHGIIASYNGESINEPWISDRDAYASGTTPTTGAQVVYPLTTPTQYQLTPQQVDSLLGDNVVYADSGDVAVVYSKSIAEEEVDFNVDGIYAVKYEAEDECGNETTVTRLIYVGDRLDLDVLTDEDGTPLETEYGGIIIVRNNLIPYPYVDTTNTNGGITFTDNGNGTITLNGTANSSSPLPTFTLDGSFIGDGSNYFIKGTGTDDIELFISNNNAINMAFVGKDDETIQLNGSYTITVAPVRGKTFNNYTFIPIIRKA